MSAKNEAKIRFTAETADFTAQIREANSTMAGLRAAMQLADAQFKNTGNSADFLKNKQSILKSELEQNKSKQEALTQKLEAAKRAYGENSSEAQSWATKLKKAQTEEQKLEADLKDTNRALEEHKEAEEKASSPLEQLTGKIRKQQDELEKLKTDYSNVALSEGKHSDAAKDLKGKINTLNGELNKNQKKLQEVTTATKETGEAARDSGAKCTFLGNMFANLASQGVTMVIQKLQEAAKAVVNLGMEFTSSMSNVEALSGATSGEMTQLETAARELGRNTIFSASQVADAFSYMALAGWDTEDMLSGIDGVLNLAAAGQMDLANASDIVTDYLTAFGLGAEDAGKFVDQMAFAMSNSNTDVEQLGEAYKNVAATAGSMGYSVEDTTAALMTMANAGVKGGEAGTGLSAIMTRLATNTKGCADELGQYGVEIYDQNGNMNSLSSILNGIAENWSDLSDEEQANLAKMIAGQNQYSKFQTVMNGLSEAAQENGQSFNDYTKALEECDGIAAQMSGTMQDNLSGDMKALGSAAEGLGLQLFDYFEGPLRAAAQGSADLLNKITDAITPQRSELQQFIDEVAESNEQVRGTIENAQGIMADATSEIGELEAYKNILLDLNGVEEKSEFQKYQVKNAVEALGETIPGLAEAFDEETGALSLTNEQLTDLFQNAEKVALQNAVIRAESDAYDALAEAAINVAKADSAVENATVAANEAMEANHQTADYLRGGYGELYNEELEAAVALDDAQKVQQEANKNMADAQKQVDDLANAYPKLLEQMGYTEEEIEQIINGTETATESMEEEEQAVEEVTEAVDEYGNVVDATLEQTAAALGMTAEEYEKFRDSVRDSMQSSVDMMNEFNGGAEISKEQILANLQTQTEGIAQWSENMARLGAAAGDGMTQGLYDALLEMGPQSANLVQELVNTLDSDKAMFAQICGEWGNALNLSNNAETLASLVVGGEAAADQIIKGFEGSKGKVDSAASGMASSMAKSADASKAMQSATSSVQSETQKAMDAAKKTVQTSMDSMKGLASSGMSAMNTAMSSQLNSMKTNVSNAMTNAVNNVSSGVSSMRAALSQTLRGPDIQIPHFSMKGAFNAKTNTVPTVSVAWWAKGAIFTRPTIFETSRGLMGAGEAGPEAILPIENLRDYVSEAVEASSSGNTFNIDLTVNGSEDPHAWAAEFARDLKQYMRVS